MVTTASLRRIPSFATAVRSATCSATAALRSPSGVEADHLREALERLANELMVDLDLSEG